MRPYRIMPKAIFVTLVALLAAFSSWWWAEPRSYLLDLDLRDRDAQGRRDAEDHLVSLGARSVSVILDRFRGTPEFSEGNGACLVVLRRIGGPAHSELLKAIDTVSTGNGQDRLGYIYALQASFYDFSRLPIWLDYLRQKNGHANARKSDGYLQEELHLHFKDAPEVADERGSLTPEFVRWYRKHEEPNGPFPRYDFPRTLVPP